MDERAIGAAALGDTGARRLASEMDGPVPAAVTRLARTESAPAVQAGPDATHAVGGAD